LDKEARELQIMIAQLQLDIQFYLAVSIGLIVSTLGLLIVGYQVTVGLYETLSETAGIIFLVFIGLSSVCATVARRYLKKLRLAQKELYNLK
jgi:hypothetical protein